MNNDGLVDITDATYIQLYATDSTKDLKRTGTPYVVPVPTTAKPTEAPTTQKPTQKPTAAPTTAKPTQAPTTQAPTTAAPTTAAPTTLPTKSLSVTATSNIYPQATTTFNPVANQITVTWWLNIPTDKMINTQFVISYDNKVLEVDKTDGVNMVYDEDDPTEISKYLIIRASKGEGTVINLEPESMPGGGIKGNASKLSGFKVTNNGERVPFISVTFNPKDGAEGKTTVDLNVEVLQLGNGSDDPYYLVEDSRIVRKDISYLPKDTAVAVYAGPFNPNAQQDPDPVQPTTQAPTEEPTLGNPLTVTAKSNVFPQATTTFESGVKRITVTYWVNISPDRLINTQFKLTYDKSKLEYDETPGVNQVYDEDDPSEVADYLVLRLTNGKDTVINTNPSDIQGGGIRGNASIANGIKATDNGNRKAFVSVTFKPKAGAEGKTEVNLDVEILQLGNGNPEADYYVINNSKVVRPDVNILPTDTATAVYAGKFNNDVQQNPDVQPTTAPEPTEAPTTVAPTTVAPTTVAPTTAKPTEPPTTVAPTTVAPTTVAPTTQAPTDPPVYDMTVRFTNNLKWPSVYVYAWGGSSTMQWPGMLMNDDGENGIDPGVHNYSASIPEDVEGYLFTAGGADTDPQTSNITDFSHEGWFVNSRYTEQNEGGKTVYTALYWGFEIGGEKVVKFTDKHNWGTVYVYTWTSGGGENAAFPGIAMTRDGDSEYGGVNYSAQIPEDSEGIIFSAGKDAPKTVDITDLDAEGWYTTDAQIEGNYIAYKWGEDPTPSGKTVKFTDKHNWGTVFVYAWTSGGGENAAFPGIAMNRDGDAEYGGVNYSAQIPEDSAGIIFSAGKDAPKTVDITDLDAEGWYTTDNQSEGNYIAYKWGETPEDPTPSGKTVKFTDKHNWSTVYVYAWTAGGGENAAFPGVAMTREGDAEYGGVNYTAQIPEDAAGIIFSAGKDAPKTVDITDLNAEGWYTTDAQSEGNYIAYKWGETPEEPTPSSKKILFTCNWGTCNVYSWNDDGGKPSGEWPGSQVTETTTNDMGEKQFVAYIPADATHIIFNDGNGTQTVNINNLNVTGYYITGGPNNALTVASW